jgi:hypothetical protein
VIGHSIRAVDSAYRYGGDEFVVLLPETDIVGAFVVAEKIRIGAEEVGLALPRPDLALSVSIGLVSHPEDGLNAEELVGAADRAMYQAKRLGKNQISGNPRPRPALPVPAASSAVAEPVAPPPAPPAPAEDRSQPIAVELGPVVEPAPVVEPGPDEAPAGTREPDDAEADAEEVRERIATASRSFDPDDQIRRAMEAFLSPSGGREGRTPDA